MRCVLVGWQDKVSSAGHPIDGRKGKHRRRGKRIDRQDRFCSVADAGMCDRNAEEGECRTMRTGQVSPVPPSTSEQHSQNCAQPSSGIGRKRRTGHSPPKMPVDAGSVSDAGMPSIGCTGYQEATPSATPLQATPPLHSITLCFSTRHAIRTSPHTFVDTHTRTDKSELKPRQTPER